ncbi:hypothetical protein N7474_008098 [Penicillium riverlandense]|uniref:uncharacterized protein n=1 Tax=Penicillium riverlandense TaxID=1903569 RepID=UPI0025480F74|nr:uncharacterized protein N7474_008098 [Penicillium riverlandense]KAJ5811797.1 hypothetical protein N7474_008098 [Penicillium riverlandense]
MNDQSRKQRSSQRQPPPALFQGPPSHNASNISLPLPPVASSRGTPAGSQPPPLQRKRAPGAAEVADNRGLLSPFARRRPSKHDIDGSEAVWQEMQSALSEVDLSAVTTENVYGEKHAQALEDLRMKQLKLAQAWARSEADDEVVDPSHSAKDGESAPRRSTSRSRESARGQSRDAAERRTPLDGVSHHTLDAETEKDILLARRRREANDRYFDRVNQGVLDVVAKLEDVAQAMRAVERESKDIWSDSESVATAASSVVSDRE